MNETENPTRSLIGFGVHERQLQAFRANRRPRSESPLRETIQRIARAQKAASPEFQAWLRHKNANGADVYVGMNPINRMPRLEQRTT